MGAATEEARALNCRHMNTLASFRPVGTAMSQTPRPDLQRAAALGINVEGRSTAEVYNDLLTLLAVKSGPQAAPTTFSLPGSMFDYKLEGNIDPAGAEEMSQYNDEAIAYVCQMSGEAIREMMNGASAQMLSSEKNKSYADSDKVVVEEMTIDGTAHQCDNTSIKVLVHRPTEVADPSRAIIYAHGGAGLAGSAEAWRSILNRYAIENNAVVFAVNYRMAPEHPLPKGIMDMTAAILHIHSQAAALKVDPARLCAAGESFGALIAVAAAGELCRRGSEGVLKLVNAIIPQNASDYYRRMGADDLVGLEKQFKPFQLHLDKIIAGDPPCDEKYLYVLPEAEIIDKYPHTAVMTTEFDSFKGCAQDLAQALHAKGRLVEWCVHPRTTHGWYFTMTHPTADLFWADSKKIFDKYL